MAWADRAIARALVEEGAAFAATGKHDKALERYEGAIKQDPDYLPAYDGAASLWLRRGDYEKVITNLERVTLRHADYAFGWYTLAYAYRKTERHDLAVMCYETYSALRPRDADPYFGLGMSEKAQGNDTEASLAFQRYLALERRQDRAGFIDRARSELEKMGVEPPAAEFTESGDRMGRAYGLLKDRRYASALAVLTEVAGQTSSQRARLWQLRARAHLGAGAPVWASAAALMSIAHAPNQDIAYKTLASAYASLGKSRLASYFRNFELPASD
jgi:tetratricopeptide (TPR) repeat protein